MINKNDILGVSTIDWEMKSTLLHEHAVNLSTAKVYVFAYSVLCLGVRIATICAALDEQNWMVYTIPYLSWAGLAEDTPTSESPKDERERQHSARKFQGSNHLHVDIQRHWLGPKRQWRKLWTQFLKCCQVCPKVSQRTLVIPRTWIRRKMVCHARPQTGRFVEQSRWTNDDCICRKRASCVQKIECFIPRTSKKQKRRKDIDTLQRGTGDSRAITTFRQSAQYLQRHSGLVPRSCSANRSSVSIEHGEPRCKCEQWPSVSSPISGRIESHQIPNVQCWSPMKLGAATRRESRKEDLFQWTKACDDAFFFFFEKETLQDNSWLKYTISIWQDTAAQAHVENIRILEMMTDPKRMDLFEATPKLVRCP